MSALTILGVEIAVTSASKSKTEASTWKSLGGQTYRHAYRNAKVASFSVAPMPLTEARDWRKALSSIQTLEPSVSTDWRGSVMTTTGTVYVSGSSLLVSTSSSASWSLNLEAPYVLCFERVGEGRWVIPSSGTAYRAGVTTSAPAWLTVASGTVTLAPGTYRSGIAFQGSYSADFLRAISTGTGAVGSSGSIATGGDHGLGPAYVTLGEFSVTMNYKATFDLTLEAK